MASEYAPVDIGITNDPNDIGEPLPVLGIVLFFDYTWSENLSTGVILGVISQLEDSAAILPIPTSAAWASCW